MLRCSGVGATERLVEQLIRNQQVTGRGVPGHGWFLLEANPPLMLQLQNE